MEYESLSTSLPQLGDRVPRRGNAFVRLIGATALRIWGWRFAGSIPNHPKMVILGAPHTTAWDFGVALGVIAGVSIRVNWLGADWIFRFPLMRWTGGVPVDRGKSQDFVSQVVEKFASRDKYALALAPEGSRKKVTRWRTGFYHIAHGAGVPVFMIGIDARRKILHFGPSWETSGDLEADMEQHVRPFYGRYRDEYSEQFGQF